MTDKFLLGNSIVGISLFNSDIKMSSCVTFHFFPGKLQISFLTNDEFVHSTISLWIFCFDISISLAWIPFRNYLEHLYHTLFRKG